MDALYAVLGAEGGAAVLLAAAVVYLIRTNRLRGSIGAESPAIEKARRPVETVHRIEVTGTTAAALGGDPATPAA